MVMIPSIFHHILHSKIARTIMHLTQRLSERQNKTLTTQIMKKSSYDFSGIHSATHLGFPQIIIIHNSLFSTLIAAATFDPLKTFSAACGKGRK